MSTELWLGIIHYFIGVLIVLALLVSLMEASRKFDRFRDSAYLLLAIGYFLLLIWALLQSMSLGNGLLQLSATICQLAGLFCLVLGYHLFVQAHAIDDDADKAPILTARPVPPTIDLSKHVAPVKPTVKGVKPQSISAASPTKTLSQDQFKDDRADWVKLLSVDSIPPPLLATSTEVVTEDVSDDEKQVDRGANSKPDPELKMTKSTASAAAPVKPTPQLTTLPAQAKTVDLSYLAQRSRKVDPEVKQLEALEQDKDGDLSAPADEKLKSEPKEGPSDESKNDETKKELMDELFPIKDANAKVNASPSQPEAKSTADPKPIAKNNEELPGETNSPKPIAAGLLAANFSTQAWLMAWPEITAVVAYLWLLTILIPQRQHRGHSLLIGGFTIVLLSTMASALLAPAKIDYTALAIHLVELLGFVLIGFASWIKIKGKVTHHFLRIVSVIYLILILFTIGLANVVVRDQVSLQLLLLLMTGVLIMILPIIHAMTYHHPSQPVQSES